MDISAVLELPVANQSLAFAIDDHKEAIEAWRQKRKPVFEGK